MKKVRKCDLKFLTHNKLSILGKPHTIEISSPLQYLTFKEEKKTGGKCKTEMQLFSFTEIW